MLLGVAGKPRLPAWDWQALSSCWLPRFANAGALQQQDSGPGNPRERAKVQTVWGGFWKEPSAGAEGPTILSIGKARRSLRNKAQGKDLDLPPSGEPSAFSHIGSKLVYGRVPCASRRAAGQGYLKNKSQNYSSV